MRGLRQSQAPAIGGSAPPPRFHLSQSGNAPSIPERKRPSLRHPAPLFVILGRSRSAAKAQTLGSMPERGGSARRSRMPTASPTMSVPAWVLGSSPRMTMREASAITSTSDWRQRPVSSSCQSECPLCPRQNRPSLSSSGRSRSAAKAQTLGSMPERGGSARRSRMPDCLAHDERSGMDPRVKPEDDDAGGLRQSQAPAIGCSAPSLHPPATPPPSTRQRSLYPRAQTSVSSSSRPSLFVIPGRSRSAAKAQTLGSMPEHEGSSRRFRMLTASPTMSGRRCEPTYAHAALAG